MNDEFDKDQEADPPSPLRVEITTLTDVGKVRSENQDFVTASVDEDEAEGRGQIIVVADGMGGHQGGATASRMSGTSVKTRYLDSGDGDLGRSLQEALIEANREIFQKASSDQSLDGMGTTTSAMVFSNSEVLIGHVGDSRIYRIRDEAIEQLTEDHSLVATMVKQGLISEEEAETHPRRNVLQRSMGVSEEVEVDIYGPLALNRDDIYLGCSDGLHGQMSENEILEIVEANSDLDVMARALIDLALERGAPDNVTVGLARVIEGGPAVPYNPKPRAASIELETDDGPDDDDGDEDLEDTVVTAPYTPAAKATPAGCLLQLLLLILLALVVGGALLMLVDEQGVVSLFTG